MSTEMDLKTLWHEENPGDMPNTKELLKKAGGLRRIFRIKLIIQTVVLIAAVVVMLTSGLHIEHRTLTTDIGLVLMLLGIISYLVTTNQLLPMLFKSSIDGSSQEYLNQLIRIKRKNEFLHRVMIDVYFSLLTTGLYLYFLQFALQMTAFKAVLCYMIPSIGLAIAWSFSKRWEFRKTLNPLNDTIKKLEALNGQLLNVN
jgi:hypothetical protein